MQISINFTEDEAQAFKNWASQVKPIELDVDNFHKQIFFNGVGAINDKLASMAQESLSNPEVRQKLKDSGVDVDQLEAELNASRDANVVTEVKDSSEHGDPKPEPEIDPAAPVEVLPDTPETTK